MRINVPSGLASDVLFLAGCGMFLVGAWSMSWPAGLMGTGLAAIVLAVVLRGTDLMGKGRKRR